MPGVPQHYCHACHQLVEFEKKAGRRDECPHCTAELHCCLNCEFYDPRLTRGCRETQAEEVRDLVRANFCNWFSFRVGPSGLEQKATGASAKAQFDALFGKAPASGDKDRARDEAKAAFEALFKK